MSFKTKEIIVGVCGSIAAYKAAELINSLAKQKANVTVVMTKCAHHFITPLTLQTLSRNRIFSDLFELPKDWSPIHTSLADKADLIVICPATASIIGKIANGICDDLLTCTVMASSAKVMICPAMNEKMYKNKVLQANIDKLKSLGYKFVGPIWGYLACGYEGKGHLAGTDTVLKEIKKLTR